VAYELGRPALVAVTGSMGKLTTVRAIGDLMASCGRPIPTGGNKGRPLSELVQAASGAWMAVALSSFQLESVVHLSPKIAVILNIKDLHLDRHQDLAETVRIKSRIFMNQGAGDILVLNRDDPLLIPLADRHWGETLFVSSRTTLERGAWVEAGRIMLRLDGETHDLGPAPARYPENILSAVVVACLLSAPPEELGKALTGAGERSG
jgi:UDP-N-acetylmuramoylalanine--D-glutamate ligase